MHIIDSDGIYGAERVLLNLAAETVRRGHDVVVATIVAPGDASDPLGEAATGMGLRHVQFRMRDGPNIHGLRQVTRFADQTAVDLIHSHGYKAGVLLASVPRRSRRWALICTLHGWTSRGMLEKRRLYELLERWLLPRFDYVVVVSATIFEAVKRGSLTGHLSKIPNGIDLSCYPAPVEPARATRCGNGGKIRLLAVGRLGAEKGFDLLIDAVRILNARGVATELRIVGEGAERPTLEDAINEHGLQQSVKLLGYQADLIALYREADFFVLSSRTEGLPMVVLEAMACGTPVIATAVGEVPGVLEGGACGWLIDGSSADDIALAVSRAAAITSKDRTSRIRRARARVEAAYSAVSMTNAYLIGYTKALDRVARARASQTGDRR